MEEVLYVKKNNLYDYDGCIYKIILYLYVKKNILFNKKIMLDSHNIKFHLMNDNYKL